MKGQWKSIKSTNSLRYIRSSSLVICRYYYHNKMDFIISDIVTIEQKYDLFELFALTPDGGFVHNSPALMSARMMGYNPTRIRIKDAWYDVMPLYEVARSVSPEDGAYHFIYIQINLNTNEYYIGKVNRKHWREIKRYQGSGLKFKNKYKGHETEFVRYFILAARTAKETEDIEAQIVDEELIADPKCLNLVCGGGGTNEHYTKEKRVTHQRQYMKSHPEQFQSMVETAKRLYTSGNSVQLQKRNAAIKTTMSDERYRDMTRERILRWRQEHPEEYERAREKNREAIRRPEVQEKRRQARKKWIEEHPEEHKAMQAQLDEARQSPEARKKRSESIKAWNKAHPEKAKENTLKRSAASLEKCCKSVNMCDPQTGEIIRSFNSLREAAKWLIDNGLATGKNPSSSISAVCQKKPCSTGYGYRKKAFGYGWEYASKVNIETSESKSHNFI